MKIFGKDFRPYDDHYFVSSDGDIYSTYSEKLLKHSIDCDGYHRVDIHGKHIKVHKLVYLVWGGKIPEGKQINHRNDNRDDSAISNLYLGNQKENIRDCERNGHRVGNTQSVRILDKLTGKEILFPSVKDFLKYSGHSVTNGSLAHCLNKKWFSNRFEVIEQKGVTTIESYKSIRASFRSGVEDKAS